MKNNKEKIGELRESLEQKEAEIENLKEQIESIEKSLTWKTIRKWDSFIDKIFPGNHPIKNQYYRWITKKRGKKADNQKLNEFQITKRANDILNKIEELKETKYKKVKNFAKNRKKPLYHDYIQNKLKLRKTNRVF